MIQETDVFYNPVEFQIIKKRLDLLQYEIKQSVDFGKELPKSTGLIAEDIFSNLPDVKNSLLQNLDFVRNEELHEVKASHLKNRRKNKKGIYEIKSRGDNSIWTSREYKLYTENKENYFLDFIDLSTINQNQIFIYIYRGVDIDSFKHFIESRNQYIINFSKIIKEDLVQPVEKYICRIEKDSLKFEKIN